jgi:hypothetical protein
MSTRVDGGGTRSGVRNGFASGADWFLQPVSATKMSTQQPHRIGSILSARKEEGRE